ncbi:hypothetical protein CAPTEDRAFT_182050 [Capitella teleta]|uniref:SAM-dependent MTase RsmB/NOP-type domain-containing protein n=1 Tax=Capitella teleta TaxID=283909 RepID=R7VCP3_CAPTE|nr:hypothetical protein CAPTEDRAFT_182050 [Capitella teleta]|eukprot:ELU16404.1 hypothetical protein CAPTEDRAFT_182050 [Capitella teleta]
MDSIFQDESELATVLRHLALPPMFTTLRINELQSSKESITDQLQEILKKQYESKDMEPLPIVPHCCLRDALYIKHRGPRLELPQLQLKVVVGVACGMAVLRGADVFAQGITGAPANLQAGEMVSVYADVDGGCRKGLTKPFEGTTIFVGNGRMLMSRRDIFVSMEKVSGMAIQMNQPLYEAPSLSGILPSLVFPQNLPSVLCSHVLNPQPGQTIIDLCAAPGGKTVHLASLMKNQGRVVALDKTSGKISKVLSNAKEWGLSCIEAYAFDASGSCCSTSDTEGPPPYPPLSFDHVLLDAPCSALGQRPSAANSMRVREVSSYPVLQRKIFTEAVALLRDGGTLVFSTCTVTAEENEQQVAWALRKFPQLTLVAQEPYLGGPGRPGQGLDEEQRRMVQRFDPGNIAFDQVDSDCIGFFIAKFIKNSIK